MLKSMPKTDMRKLAKFFEDNIDHISLGLIKEIKPYVMLYHYTSLSKMFSILENDLLWLSSQNFTNDYSEGKLLGKKWLNDHKYNADNFIFCVSKEGNLLSQWRSYSKDDGAAIGFDISLIKRYSLLHTDFDKTKKYEYVDGIALPVLYISKESSLGDANPIIGRIGERLRNNSNYASTLRINDFVPYIKNEAFHEEQEYRLLFSNSNGELSECIRFRELTNGTRIPYIEIKSGSIKESQKKLCMSKRKYNNMKKNRNCPGVIVVPNYSNQDELCSTVREYVKNDAELQEEGEIRVFCDGRLPIRSIKIGPMPDNKRIKEQVEYYCKNKYWLRDVEVSVSDIPYVSSIYS